jgi:hypothetical protein
MFYAASGLATTHEWHLLRKSLRFMGALNSQRSMSNLATDTSASTTSGTNDVQVHTIDAATTDIFFDITVQHTDGTTDICTLVDAWAVVVDDQFPLA